MKKPMLCAMLQKISKSQKKSLHVTHFGRLGHNDHPSRDTDLSQLLGRVARRRPRPGLGQFAPG